jgi:hypothetical protein
MQRVRSFIDGASLGDIINSATTRREAQLKVEEEFDHRDVNVIAKKCGEETLIDVFKTRSELNRELTRVVNSKSILYRAYAYHDFLDVMDNFNESMSKKVEHIKNGEECECRDLSRTLDDFKEFSLNIRTKNNT